MARRRHTPDQIFPKLREVDRLLAEGELSLESWRAIDG